MAFVARRPKGRFEIRESVHTEAGPRSRTLATFAELDDAAMARAGAAATRPFRREEVLASARRAGAPVAPTSADDAARRLLLELRSGRVPSPGLRRLLIDDLRALDGPPLAAGDSIGDWIGASDEARGEALRDLLMLADRVRPGRPSLVDKVLRLTGALKKARIPHAFGDVTALAYYAEPRATVDIDVNLFVGPEEYRRVLDVLEPMGITRAPSVTVVERDGQGRLWWGPNPLDLFFQYDDVHAAMRDWARVVPFGPDQIPILAPEHLVVAKVVFNRAKDWLDLEQVLVATPVLDFGEIDRWLDHLVGAEDDRATRFNELRRSVT